MPSSIWSGRPRGPYPWNQRTNKQRLEDELLVRFKTEADRAEAARERYFRSVFVREKFFRLTRKRKAYDDYHKKYHAKRLQDEYAEAIHSALRTSWQVMADTDELTYQYPIEAAATRISRKNREEWLETQIELDNWDLKHTPVKEDVEPPDGKIKGAKGGKGKKPPPGPVPKSKDLKVGKGGKLEKKFPEIPEEDAIQLPDPLLWGKEAFAYVETVKAKREKELQDKFEAQQQERKEKLEKEEAERQLQEVAEKKRLDDIDWEYHHGAEALRMQEEQRIADEEDKRMVEHRVQLAQALMEERQAEWDEVTNRDHELLSMMREDCLDEVYKEWLAWELARKKKEEERKAKRLRLCTEIILQTALDEYLGEQGEWQGVQPIGMNKELGIVLADIHGIADSPPDPPELPNLTQYKLKIAVVGTPFSGKSTISKKLEHEFECVRIEMQNVVTSAVALADAEEKVHKAQLAEEVSKREQAEAQRILEERQRIEAERQQEALGLKDIYLRSKSRIESGSLEPKPPESPDKNPLPELEQNTKTETKTGKGKDAKGESLAEKGKAVPKEEMAKDAKKSQRDTKKQKPEKGKKKEKVVEAPPEPPPEPVPEPRPFGPPPPEPHPLAYLTPKARHGMDIKLALEGGLQAPEHAMAGLLLLTLSNLQEYSESFPAEPEVSKKDDLQSGKKGGPASKTGGKKGAAKGKAAPVSSKGKADGKPDPKAKKGAASVGLKEGATVITEPGSHVLGFILDGFPTNVQEAKALEWQLSGINLDYVEKHASKASRIAPPPELTMRPRSGLDGYFQLEGIDENESFKRAMGKVVDEKTGKIYHLEYDPPPTMKTNLKEKGLVQRLVPVEELDVVRPKVVAGLEAWPPVCQYLGKIVNVFQIAQSEQDGKKMVDTVAPSVLATKFLDGWAKTQAAKVAAQAGLEAESVAFQALHDAEDASKLANEVAHKLWCAKLAEVETEQGLDALGGDTLAKQLIKNNASFTVVKMLDEACKAAKDAQEAAEAAGMASLHAEQRANLAKDNIDEADLEFAVHVKDEAEEAAEVAKQAAIRADEAHKKAVMAFEAATAALQPKPEMEASREEKEDSKKGKDAKGAKGAKDAKEPKGPKDAKSAKDAKGAKDSKSSKDTTEKTPDVSPKPPSPAATLPAPVVLEPVPSMEKSLAVSLHSEWEGVEANYLKQLEMVFYTLNQEKSQTRNRVVEAIDQFISFLQKRDERQLIFYDFQEKWNRIETPQRLDRKFKPKLQAEVAKLDKALTDICARRNKQCFELSEKSLVHLLESRTVSLVKVFTGLVQTELDRHVQSCSLLNEFYTKTLGSELLAFRCDLEEESATESNQKFPIPGWLASLSAPLPKLYQAIKKVMSVTYSIIDVMAGKAPPPKGDKEGKKGGNKKPEKPGKKDADKSEKKDIKGSAKKIQDVQEVVQIIDIPQPTLDPSIPPATAREHEVLLSRLQRIATVALGYFNELQPIMDGAFKRMNEWSAARLKAEDEVIQEVINLCTEAAEEQIPLWYRVFLDGDVFQVDQSQLVLECPIKETTNLNLWFCKVMENLLNDFKGVSPGANYMTGALARATVNGAITKTHVMFKDDLKESLLPRMPAPKRNPLGPFQVWQDLSEQMFQEILTDPAKEEKFIDWRGLLIAMIDAQFSLVISSSSCEDILAARAALVHVATIDKEGVGKGPDTWGYLLIDDLIGIKLWFDPSIALAPGEFDLGLALKIFLYNLLEDGPKGVQYQKLLLYLCRDPDKEQALQKAFNAVADSGTLSHEHHLTPEAVLGILYPGGIEAAWDQAIVPFILDDLYNLLYYVAKEKWDIAERGKQSDMAGSEESGSNDDNYHRLEGLEVGSSTSESDHKTVKDFLDFAYQEFPVLSQAETVKDFLCHLKVKKDPYSHLPDEEQTPYKCDVHVTLPTVPEEEVEEADPFAIPTTFTVHDILATSAHLHLSIILNGNYGSGTMHLFDKVTIEDAEVPEDPPLEAEKPDKGKKKKSKDKKDEKDKGEKKDKKE